MPGTSAGGLAGDFSRNEMPETCNACSEDHIAEGLALALAY